MAAGERGPWGPHCGAKRSTTGEPCRETPLENGRCRFHGGRVPAGTESGAFRHGRYSKLLPRRMAESYAVARQDPELLSLRDEMALTDARLAELLQRLDEEAGPARWAALLEAWKGLQAAAQGKDMRAVRRQAAALGRIIRDGEDDREHWSEIFETMEARRRFAESERKRLVALEQTLTVEKALVLVSALVEVVRRNVSDRGTLAAIQHDLRGILGRAEISGGDGGAFRLGEPAGGDAE